MINLEKAKIVLYDFDDTLCIHKKHGLHNDTDYAAAMVNQDIEWWDKIGCEPNKAMEKFMNICANKDMEQGLISAVGFSISSTLKRMWVLQKYGIQLNDYCTGSFEGKAKIIQGLIIAKNLSPENILFIDDYWKNLEMVAQLGVQVATPMEIVNFIYKN